MKRILGASLVAISCTVLALPSAAVADNKVIPGAMCQNIVSSPFGVYIRAVGGIANLSSDPLHVACPIWRATGSSTLDHVWVRVENTVGGDPTTCWVFSQDGGSDAYSQTGSQSLNSIGTASLHFVTDGLQHYGGGSFAVRCNLGESGGSVRSIRTQE
jgi:hypothetical protein